MRLTMALAQAFVALRAPHMPELSTTRTPPSNEDLAVFVSMNPLFFKEGKPGAADALDRAQIRASCSNIALSRKTTFLFSPSVSSI